MLDTQPSQRKKTLTEDLHQHPTCFGTQSVLLTVPEGVVTVLMRRNETFSRTDFDRKAAFIAPNVQASASMKPPWLQHLQALICPHHAVPIILTILVVSAVASSMLACPVIFQCPPLETG